MAGIPQVLAVAIADGHLWALVQSRRPLTAPARRAGAPTPPEELSAGCRPGWPEAVPGFCWPFQEKKAIDVSHYNFIFFLVFH